MLRIDGTEHIFVDLSGWFAGIKIGRQDIYLLHFRSYLNGLRHAGSNGLLIPGASDLTAENTAEIHRHITMHLQIDKNVPLKN